MVVASRTDLANFDPVLRAIDSAPLGERFTPEQEEELAAALEDIQAGRARLIPHAEIGEGPWQQAG